MAVRDGGRDGGVKLVGQSHAWPGGFSFPFFPNTGP